MSQYAINRVTEYRYNLDGRLVELEAHNSVTGNQVTTWTYGTTLADSGVASKDLLRFKTYPDSTGSGDRVKCKYNRLGELIELEDQNGTVHSYTYDKLGRLTSDKVPTFGSGIDQGVKAIGRTYDARGYIEKITSYSDTALTTVVNEVKLAYNGFGQVTADYQAHGGAVNELTTPKVTYEYADGTGNTARRLKVVYPDGREIAYDYGEGGSTEQEEIDNLTDRVREIRDVNDSNRVLTRYAKRGAKSTVRIEYPQPEVELTYIKQSGEPVGDAGDQYTGLDRFNRIEDIRWRSTDLETDLDRYQYGFDRAGNRRWRRNAVAASDAGGWDEAYQYDGLYQLTQLARGNLNLNRTAIAAIPKWQEDFGYDPTGNWLSYLTRDDTGTVDLNQTRTHNEVNEITAIDGSSATVGYDGAGNMTVMPKVGDWNTAQDTVWDAWNRMVEISEDEEELGAYVYDGLTRRVTKLSEEDSSPVTRHYYYSDQWQILEERTGSNTTADRQFIWGLRYIDDLVLRDRFEGVTSDQRHYVTHDQWHVTAIADDTGAVQERYAYKAFGDSLVLTPSFGSRTASDFDWETKFGAYRWDGEAKLYAVRYRLQHSTGGRWTSRDPVERLLRTSGEDVRNLSLAFFHKLASNVFSYVNNSPAAKIDSSGLWPKFDFDDCDQAEKNFIKNAYGELKEEAEKLMFRLSRYPEKNNPLSTLLDCLEKDKGTVEVECCTHCVGKGKNTAAYVNPFTGSIQLCPLAFTGKGKYTLSTVLLVELVKVRCVGILKNKEWEYPLSDYFNPLTKGKKEPGPEPF